MIDDVFYTVDAGRIAYGICGVDWLLVVDLSTDGCERTWQSNEKMMYIQRSHSAHNFYIFIM